MEDVRNNWYVGKLAVEVCQWAIGEKEDIFLDYLARRERTEEGYYKEKHYVVTDRRVLRFDLNHESIQYSTVFTCNKLSSINQVFPIPSQSLDWALNPPYPDTEVVLESRKEPYIIKAPAKEDYRSGYKEFITTLAALFPKVER